MLKTSSACEWVREYLRELSNIEKSSCVHHGDLRTWRTWMLWERQIFICERKNFHAMIFLIFIFFHFMFSCFYSVGQKSFTAWFVCVSRFYQKKKINFKKYHKAQKLFDNEKHFWEIFRGNFFAQNPTHKIYKKSFVLFVWEKENIAWRKIVFCMFTAILKWKYYAREKLRKNFFLVICKLLLLCWFFNFLSCQLYK